MPAAFDGDDDRDDVAYLTAVETARRIRGGRLASTDAVEACLARIAALDPAIRAVLDLHADAARRRAREADAAAARGEWWGPLHGVPVTVKDVFDVAGMRTTFGYPPTRNNVASRDATAVARLRAAGAVILGKTHVPMGSYDWQCRSPVGGRTNNPWDPGRTPGGSSGGSAAAVAAGFAALELGSDAAGSIRVPAHFCGVLGMKTTERRVSSVGHGEFPGAPRSMRHLAAYGPIARSVEDLELALAIIAGADERGPDAPPVPFAPAPERPASALRVAWTDGFGGLPVSADTAAALRGLVAKLEAAGARVERAHPPLDPGAVLEAWGEINGMEVGVAMPWFGRAALRAGAGYRFGPGPFSRGLRRGLTLDAKRYFAALTRRDAMSAEMERFLAPYDAWLCPVAAIPAFTHRRTGAAIEVDGRPVPYSTAAGAYAVFVSLLGNPSASVPAAISADGLPIGVQVVGKRWDDAGVLAVARTVEALTGGFRRPPGLDAGRGTRPGAAPAQVTS